MKKYFVLLNILLLSASIYAQSEESKGVFIDTRDNKEYNWVKIGEQIWMAENLAFYASSGCWIYDHDSTYLAKYGYLYDWKTAKEVCPEGWHLPSVSEWKQLEDYIQFELGYNDLNVGMVLKSKYDWDNEGNGLDVFGFNGLPGGFRQFCKDKVYFDTNFEDFYNLNIQSDWWTSSERENDKEYAKVKRLTKDANALMHGYSCKLNGISVRCVKD